MKGPASKRAVVTNMFDKRPFAVSSPWNTPLSANTVYQNETAPETVDFRNVTKGNPWVTWVKMINKRPGTKLVTWRYGAYNNGEGVFINNSAINIVTPSPLNIVSDSDHWCVFPDADGIHYWESWLTVANSPTSYTSGYLVKSRIDGSGWGFNGHGAGIRAAGASLLGGLIQKWEFDAGVINHAMALELDHRQLKAGAVQSNQFVYPAVCADGGSVDRYTGTIPMGARFAIPPGIDISNYAPLSRMVAKALQVYGGYVVDTAGFTVSMMAVDYQGPELPQITQAESDDLFAMAFWLRSMCVMVTN